MEVIMMRKASSAEWWKKDRAGIKTFLGHEPRTVEAIIEKTVIMEPKEFDEFTSDFLSDRKFITDNLDRMFIDENGIWHCIEITSPQSRYNVLVESEGYDYARYTALTDKE